MFKLPENPHELKPGYIGFTDPYEPRVLLARGFNEGSQYTFRDMVSWLLEECSEHWGSESIKARTGTYLLRHNCHVCMQELKESL